MAEKISSHPKNRSKISHFFFTWQLPILFHGFRKEITENNLFEPLNEHESQYLGDKLENVWIKEVGMYKENASLWRVLRKVFGFECIKYGLCLIPSQLVFRMLIPILIGKLIRNYSKNEETLLISILLLVVAFLRIMVMHLHGFAMEHLGMKIRVACSSLIYRKCLKLKQATLAEVKIGQIVNLLATDVTKFNMGIAYIHYVWLAPLQMLIVICSLYNILGVTSVTGIVVFLFYWPLQMFLTKKIAFYRLKMAFKTDRRVRLLKEIIDGVKVIKMFSWEMPFRQLVEKYRKSEMKLLKASLYTTAIGVAFAPVSTKSAVFLSIFVYLLNGNSLNPEYVFVVSGFFEYMRVLTATYLQWGTIGIGEIVNSVKRIESFLKSGDIPMDRNNTDGGISIEEVCVKYDNKNIFSDLSLTIKSKQLVAIVGNVGCGKTTLLQMILGEIYLYQGCVKVGGTFSYASQDPWLYNGTIRDNILLGEPFDESKYNQVIKMCALEHDFSILPYGDMTLIGDKGSRLSGGQKSRVNLARCVYKNADCYLLDDPLSALDLNVSRYVFKNCIRKYLEGKLRILVTHQLQFLKDVDYIYLIENGKIASSGTYQEVKNDRYFHLLKSTIDNTKETKEQNTILKQIEYNPDKEENLKSGLILYDIYLKYFKSAKAPLVTILVFFFTIITYMLGGGIEYFLSLWANLEQTKKGSSPGYFLYIYVACVALLIILSLFHSFTMMTFLTLISKNLHNTMLKKIIYAPSCFFNINPSGRIINRFSSDIGQLDTILPRAFINSFLIFSISIAIIIINIIVNYWILLPTVPLMIILLFFRKLYLRISLRLKRIEARSRSPIFSHVTSTLQGLITIRAQKADPYQRKLFENLQNKHSSAFYLFLACESAFGFWLDFCCCIYYGILLYLLLFSNLEVYSGNIGLILTQSNVLMGMLQFGLKQFTEMENQMVTVERIIEYTKIPSENDNVAELSKSWCVNGKLEFRSVSFQYQPNYPLVLKQLSFVIHPKEKIGIVGRTGAGKSSIISVLFRLFEFEGNIFIDDVDTKTLSLKDLRSSISIIPQEPVLFSSTLRSNLDPCDEYQDSQLWDALEEVELKKLFFDLPGGLSSKIVEGGMNFSVGQRQLICLARAIIKMNKVLVLDEATANVDFHTEELIQNTIKKKFKECTVLTIAHRLHNVLEFDKVLVMDDGEIVEFDCPSILLGNSDGFLYKLINNEHK